MSIWNGPVFLASNSGSWPSHISAAQKAELTVAGPIADSASGTRFYFSANATGGRVIRRPRTRTAATPA